MDVLLTPLVLDPTCQLRGSLVSLFFFFLPSSSTFFLLPARLLSWLLPQAPALPPTRAASPIPPRRRAASGSTRRRALPPRLLPGAPSPAPPRPLPPSRPPPRRLRRPLPPSLRRAPLAPSSPHRARPLLPRTDVRVQRTDATSVDAGRCNVRRGLRARGSSRVGGRGPGAGGRTELRHGRSIRTSLGAGGRPCRRWRSIRAIRVCARQRRCNDVHLGRDDFSDLEVPNEPASRENIPCAG